MMDDKAFDEKYMDVIQEMITHLQDSKLTMISLTTQDKENEDWEFKINKVTDRFSEEHPYCKRECDYCANGKHSMCMTPKECHDTDEACYWVDLD